MTVVGVVNRHQAAVVAYLVEENRLLKEQLPRDPTRQADDAVRGRTSRTSLSATTAVPIAMIRTGFPVLFGKAGEQ